MSNIPCYSDLILREKIINVDLRFRIVVLIYHVTINCVNNSFLLCFVSFSKAPAMYFGVAT